MTNDSRSPKRIQMSRQKPWRAEHPDAVIVDRRTKWGNPFWHAQRFWGVELSVALYADMVRGVWDPSLVTQLPDGLVRSYYEGRSDWLVRIRQHPLEVARHELRGRDLACWCALDAPCHADVLLELANA